MTRITIGFVVWLVRLGILSLFDNAMAITSRSHQQRGNEEPHRILFQKSHTLVSRQNRRELHPRHHSHTSGSSYSEYQGCLAYASSELPSKWIFPGKAPSCSSSSSSTTSSGGSSGGGSSNGGSSGSQSSSSSGSSGSENDGASDNGGSDSTGESGNDGYSSGSNGNENNNEANGSDQSQSNGNDAGDEGENDDGNSKYGIQDNPTGNFDIETCDTYSSLWMWDLSLSCQSALSFDDCECSFAKELKEMGLLSCDDATKCPSSCDVCLTCMYLLGCSNTPQPPHQGPYTPVSSQRSNIMIYVVAAAISTIIIGAVALSMSRHRNKDSNPTLAEHLFVDSDMDPQPKLFLAPANSNDIMEYSPRANNPDVVVEFEKASPVAEVAFYQNDDALPAIEEGVWLAPVTNDDDNDV